MKLFGYEEPQQLGRSSGPNPSYVPSSFSTGVADAGVLKRQLLTLQEECHRQEREQAYRDLQRQITDFVRLVVPRGRTVLVVSKGDEILLDVPGRHAWHFPRAVNGLYAGCYPADSREAIAHLNQLRSEGAEYLVIPSTAFWWLDFYRSWVRALHRRHKLVGYLEGVSLAFKLQPPRGETR